MILTFGSQSPPCRAATEFRGAYLPLLLIRCNDFFQTSRRFFRALKAKAKSIHNLWTTLIILTANIFMAGGVPIAPDMPKTAPERDLPTEERRRLCLKRQRFSPG
jgi:hypothetical protein